MAGRTMAELSVRQRQVWERMMETQGEHGRPATFRDVADSIGISKTRVGQLARRLGAIGYVVPCGRPVNQHGDMRGRPTWWAVSPADPEPPPKWDEPSSKSVDAGRKSPIDAMAAPLPDAKRSLVEANMWIARAAVAATRKKRPPGSGDDLYQAACAGLMRAARDYDETQGASFGAYAAQWVKRAVRSEAAKLNSGASSLATEDGDIDVADHRRDEAASEGAAGLRGDIQDAVMRLPAAYREVVMRSMRGESAGVIQETMGLSPQKLGEMQAEAHGRLREMLANYA